MPAAPNSTARLDVEELRRARREIEASLHAPLTESGYRNDARAFSVWCQQRGLACLPAAPETVCLFVTDIIVSGGKITSAARRVAGIADQHRKLGLEVPVNAEVYTLLRAARRFRPEQPRRMRALTTGELRKIAIRLRRQGTPAAFRDRCLMVLGFASGLRRSNLSALRIEDVEVDRRGLVLHVGREKNNQEGRERLIALAAGKRRSTCPLRAYREWLRVRGSAGGPVFVRLDHARTAELLPMTGESIRKVVKRAVAGAGLDPAKLSVHSLRSSMITEAAANGVPDLSIAVASGHRSMQVLRGYIRPVDIWRAPVSAALGL